MLLSGRITKQAIQDAAHLFVQHQREENVLTTPEPLTTLAQTQAEDFYQNGTIFRFLRPAQLGSQQEITTLYTAKFADTYTHLKEEMGESTRKNILTAIEPNQSEPKPPPE